MLHMHGHLHSNYICLNFGPYCIIYISYIDMVHLKGEVLRQKFRTVTSLAEIMIC